MDAKPVEWRPCEVATVGCSPLTSWALISTEERDHEEMLERYEEMIDRTRHVEADIEVVRNAIVEYVLREEWTLARTGADRLKGLLFEQFELYRNRTKFAKLLSGMGS